MNLGSNSYIIANLRAVWGRAYVRIVGLNREPSWVVFSIVLPLFGIAAYVYVYKALGSPNEFIGYVILGGAMTAFWINVLWAMSAQFYWEKETGNLELYMIAPISRMAILLGMAVGGLFSTGVKAISTLALGAFIFGVAFITSSPLLLLGIFLLTMASLYGMGMMFSSLFMLYGREAWHTCNLMEQPVYLLSGFYFPVRALGIYVAAGASLIPMTLGLDAMRQLIFSGKWGFLPPDIELALLVILTVLFLGLAKVSLDYMEKWAKREGRLTLQHQ